MKKIVLVMLENGEMLYETPKNFEAWDRDVLIYEEEIEHLINIEMDDCSHADYVEDYDNKEEFYLSNASRESYIEYIRSILDDKTINEELAYAIQELVVEGIKNKVEQEENL